MTICGVANSRNQQSSNTPTQLSHELKNPDQHKEPRQSNTQSTSTASPGRHSCDVSQPNSPETLQKKTTSTLPHYSQIPSCFLPLPMASGDRSWGLGTERKAGADLAIATKIAHFQELKTQGVHFNHTLARNRSFHNPHINDKLVKWVGLDETGTNFPTMANVGSTAISWDPKNPSILQEGDIASLCRAQKTYDESREAHAKTRSQIDFQPGRHDSKRSRRHTTQHPPHKLHQK